MPNIYRTYEPESSRDSVLEYAGDECPALKIERSSPYVSHSEFRHNNYCPIWVDATDSLPIRIEECEIWGNSMHDDAPNSGGIYVRHGSGHIISANFVHGNDSGETGGIYLSYTTDSAITGNTITANTGGYRGGGVQVRRSTDTILCGNTISGNTVPDSWDGCGGGVYVYQSGYTTLIGNTITNNAVTCQDGRAGGVYVTNSNYLTVTGNTISDNSVEDGDAGGLRIWLSANAVLVGNVITGNTASGLGGGVIVSQSDDTVLTANTIAGNTAHGEGGAILLYQAHDAVLSSNIIKDNHTATGSTGGIYVTGDTERLSLAGDPNDSTFNIISGNDGYEVCNDSSFDPEGSTDVDATYVVWCTDDPSEIQGHIYDYFDHATKAIVYWYPFHERIPGDLNDDWDVGLDDLAQLLAYYGETSGMTYAEGDMDADGDVDLADLAELLGEYGTTCN